MSEGAVVFERHDTLAVLTLSNPGRRNAIDGGMAARLADAAREITADDAVRAVLLRGEGGVFCAGGDLKGGVVASAGEDPASLLRTFYDNALSLLDVDIPCVAAVAGPAYGAGLALALTCDIRLAAGNARLAANFVRLGLHPGMASTWLLARATSLSRATELLMTGRTVDAEEAHTIGLVHELRPADGFDAAALEYAQRLAHGPTLALRLVKQTLRENTEDARAGALAREIAAQQETFQSSDLREGLVAFATRREPDFEGR